jgi:hypothetical protein
MTEEEAVARRTALHLHYRKAVPQTTVYSEFVGTDAVVERFVSEVYPGRVAAE